MTFKEAKERTLKLLDEYVPSLKSSDDEYIEEKLPMAIDMAQKELSKFKRPIKIVELTKLEKDEGGYILPSDFVALRRIWRGASAFKMGFCLSDRFILNSSINPDGIRLEYFAFPSTVDFGTPEEYTFTLPLDLQEAIPFYAAMVIGSSDLTIDISQLQRMYNAKLMGIDTTQSNSIQIVNARI